MTCDFHQLQTIHCFEAITLRVPSCWQCGPSQELEGSWCCCEENEETGTLWITLDRFWQPGGSGGPDGRWLVDSLMSDLSKDSDPPLEESREEIDGGCFWKRIRDFTEDGEPLRGFRYNFFLFQENEVTIVDFNFVLARSALDDPAIRDLVAVMDREIRAARIEPL